MINYTKFFLEDSLYTKFKLSDFENETLVNLFFYAEKSYICNSSKTLDSYCLECGTETTFVAKDSDFLQMEILQNGYLKFMHSGGPKKEIVSEHLYEHLESYGVFIRKFKCPRHPELSSHDHVVVIKVANGEFYKIGQYPTIKDLSSNQIEKFKKLNNSIFLELSTSIGLFSHGVGVGSYVYLRRIIEKHIVMPVLEELITKGTIDRKMIAESDFKNKIKLAKNHLPPFLVENPKVYSFLSKGIHQLEENECLKYYPSIRKIVEIILTERLEQLKEKKNKSELSKLLDNI